MNLSTRNLAYYFFLSAFGFLMIYPLLWLFLSSFKTNKEIFGSLSLLPSVLHFDSYLKGWKGSGQFTFGLFFMNSLKLVVPTVIFTILSSVVVAYGFARFHFPLKKILFGLMLSVLMLPDAVVIIPRYILFKHLDWLNSYLPFIVPAMFACYPFFVYLMIQFFRGIPKELDESAVIDGCGSLTILTKILLPLCVPAVVSMGIFQFIWTWNDFFNTLVYVDSVRKYTVALGLRMSMDTGSGVDWNQIMAMSIVSILPCIILFFAAQKYFVEGISTTGLKG